LSPDPPPSFWYNGQLIAGDTLTLAIADPGLLYGATVFTTLRVYGDLDHPLTQWAGHCDRLRTSLQNFGWPAPDWDRLRHGATLLLAQFPVLRLVVFPDGREWITGRHLPPDLAQRQQQGITAWLANSAPDPENFPPSSPPLLSRSLPTHKTGTYLAPWLALQQAQQAGAQEASVVDAAGNWLETSTGNLWAWSEGQWWTPPIAAGILPGLLRNYLIQALQCQNEEVKEAIWSPDLVERFTAIAYTNCVMEIIPIHTILRAAPPLTYQPFPQGWQKLQRWLYP
jgi:branched-subunit amino acid aminotransferase/4-amino-4-deoxychorismate lyase